ncbi:hypothetical protein TRFO_17871 [Tritrichomonas foetus]|uniref:Uncharacterized protein n=1 Tax=Tritrichomonas foetus TaxID=1144522 RepID=A0A1J4KMK9_9EUKA|nr:hypothetical protein TRFO_17871 [Tritrichomonas foetus]|eukprot:OHT12378.1 hypothetical protein TRFO_17871 [Tritrichomonas foetus]
MFRNLSSQKRVIGVGVFWLDWALDVIPVGFTAYCIYLCTLLAHSYWQKVNGSGSLACCAIAAIFAAAAIATHMLFQFGCLQSLQSMMKYISFGSTVVALIIHAILLTFFTPITASRSYINFNEYTIMNAASDADAQYYSQLNTTNSGKYQIFKFVWDRTVNQKIPLTAFFILWGVCFSLYFLGFNYLECHKPSPSRQIPQQSQFHQPEDQTNDDLQPLHQVPNNDNEENNNDDFEDDDHDEGSDKSNPL